MPGRHRSFVEVLLPILLHGTVGRLLHQQCMMTPLLHQLMMNQTVARMEGLQDLMSMLLLLLGMEGKRDRGSESNSWGGHAQSLR